MKNYLIFSLKRYIPLFVVSFVVCFLFSITVFVSVIPDSATFTRPIGSDVQYTSIFGDYSTIAGIIMLAFPVVIFTILLPFFANSYRYSLQAADTFYQIGKNKKMIRWFNNILLLSAFIVSFTTAFFMGFFILIFGVIPNFGRADEVIGIQDGYQYEIVRHYFSYNVAYYIPIYFCFIFIIVLNYAISYYLITRANNRINSIILLLLGELILSIGLMSPIWVVLIANNYLGLPQSFINENLLFGTRASSFVGPIALIIYFLDGLVTGETPLFLSQLVEARIEGPEIFALVLSVVSLLIFMGVAALGIYKFLKEDETSGEYAGKPIGRGPMQYVIFHVGFGLIGLWSGLLSSVTNGLLISGSVINIISLFTSIGMTGAVYYVFYGLLRRNFRLTKKDIPLLFGSVGVNFLIGLSIQIIALVSYFS